MKKTKIAICLRDMRVGGVESVCVRMMDALIKTGRYDITVVSYTRITTPIYAEWFAAHPDVRTYVLYPSRLLGTKLPHFFLWRLIMHWARDVYRFVRRSRIRSACLADVDVFIDFYDFSFAKEFKKINRPKIAWWHSSINKFVGGGYARYMAGYDRMVVLTDGFMRDVIAAHPEMDGKIVRIYNPIDVHDIRSRADMARMDGDYFSYVARLDGDKDADTAICAFDKFWCDAGCPDVDLVICGDGHLAAQLRQMAAALPSGGHIRFMGTVKNPFGIMAGARANILSSYAEGLPTVVIEGLILDTPEIASDCPNGPREILMDGRLGMLYAPGDVAGLAQCMERVWRGKWMHPSDAVADSLRRFDIDEIVPQIEKLIKSVNKK